MTSASYLDFDRAAWAALRGATPLTLGEADLVQLKGLNEPVSLAEVEAIYLPVVRFLASLAPAGRAAAEAFAAFLHPDASSRITDRPFHRRAAHLSTAPFVIGIAGSVAVGKSTFARVLRAMLARVPGEPRVDLVTTDGFLLPNEILLSRGLLGRKGFPESYDVRRLVAFLDAVKRGDAAVRAPVYSHQVYDIVPDRFQVVDRPDIVIIEGLNVLQGAAAGRRPPRAVVSEFFQVSIYLDAAEEDIETWYVARFLALRETVFRDPSSYFHRYAGLSDEAARATAHEIWRTINGVNLRENIAPTRERAGLVLEKGPDHAVERVRLRPPSEAATTPATGVRLSSAT